MLAWIDIASGKETKNVVDAFGSIIFKAGGCVDSTSVVRIGGSAMYVDDV